MQISKSLNITKYLLLIIFFLISSLIADFAIDSYQKKDFIFEYLDKKSDILFFRTLGLDSFYFSDLINGEGDKDKRYLKIGSIVNLLSEKELCALLEKNKEPHTEGLIRIYINENQYSCKDQNLLLKNENQIILRED